MVFIKSPNLFDRMKKDDKIVEKTSEIIICSFLFLNTGLPRVFSEFCGFPWG